MEKIQKVSAVEGWSTSWTEKKRSDGVQDKLKRRTLGDKTLKARFGVGEVAGALFDFARAEGVV